MRGPGAHRWEPRCPPAESLSPRRAGGERCRRGRPLRGAAVGALVGAPLGALVGSGVESAPGEAASVLLPVVAVALLGALLGAVYGWALSGPLEPYDGWGEWWRGLWRKRPGDHIDGAHLPEDWAGAKAAGGCLLFIVAIGVIIPAVGAALWRALM